MGAPLRPCSGEAGALDCPVRALVPFPAPGEVPRVTLNHGIASACSRGRIGLFAPLARLSLCVGP